MKYSLSPRKIPRANCEGFPDGSGYISSYIPTGNLYNLLKAIEYTLYIIEMYYTLYDQI